MPGRPKDDRARVLGPYEHKKRQEWRLIAVNPGATRPEDRQRTLYFPTREDADKAKREIEERICNVTVEMAIDAYEHHLQQKGTIGYAETIRRIRLFCSPVSDLLVSRLTRERAQQLYDDFRGRTIVHFKKDGTPAKDHGKPISVSYHRAALINSRSMAKFAIREKRWLRSNPFADVEGIGKRNSGKTTLTLDEATKFYEYCLARAQADDATALGLLLALALALRSADVCKRIVRDVDMDGALLRIHGAKTKKSNRPRKVPTLLQPLLRKLAAGRGAFEPLFAWRRKGELRHHTHRWLEEGMVRFCKGAGVPYVCPHALKSTAGEVLAEDGEAAETIIRHLSHDDGATTRRHYVRGGAMEQAAAERGFAVISGGKGK
jgi:integrase